MKRVAIGIVIGVAITLVIIYAPRFITPVTETPETSETHVYIDGKIVVGGDGEPIELTDNPNATDPTYAELLAFLEADQIDEYSYIVGPPKVAYICADFARDVHNNAEAAGIRAAWVGIDLEGQAEGHALNAFQTTDRGLVFIDCTGVGLWDETGDRTCWDRRAYVEVGQPYQVAFIERAQTRFKFLVSQPYAIDKKSGVYFDRFVTDNQILERLEELGWIWSGGVQMATHEPNLKMLEWSRTHNTEELGLQWMQEWVAEHQLELYGEDFEPCFPMTEIVHYQYDGVWTSSTSSPYYSHDHVLCAEWYIAGDWLDTSWFQPVEKLIDVDGIPILWRIDWEMTVWWYDPFGNKSVESLSIHW
jgi:hypothetical protein